MVVEMNSVKRVRGSLMLEESVLTNAKRLGRF